MRIAIVDDLAAERALLKDRQNLFILSVSKASNWIQEGGRSVYRIAVLAEQEAERQRYAEQITRFCESKGLFPQVVQYDDQERFFEAAQKDAPTNAVIALSAAGAAQSVILFPFSSKYPPFIYFSYSLLGFYASQV